MLLTDGAPKALHTKPVCRAARKVRKGGPTIIPGYQIIPFINLRGVVAATAYALDKLWV